WKGDSGSSAFAVVSSLARPMGVASFGVCQSDPDFVLNVSYVGVDYFRDWAGGIIGNPPSVGAASGYERSDGVTSMVFRTASNAVKELALPNQAWTLTDLTSRAGAT